jgi:predicted aspartyl protease
MNRLILDTGASRTLVNRDIIERLGYSLSASLPIARVATGSRIENMPVIAVNRISALGVEFGNLEVLCHNLPSGTSIDGLLGLNFFRNQRLTIDFREGLITLD